MRPPDIHGEFMPTDTYFSDGWRARLEDALNASSPRAREFVDLLCEDSALPAAEVWPSASTELLDEVDQLGIRRESRRYGLAHSLAEQGNLPMYGMPTRVRDLYVGTRESASTRQTDWLTIDRDLDLAVYEFAPGSVIVKDKREHVCVFPVQAASGRSCKPDVCTVRRPVLDAGVRELRLVVPLRLSAR
jgi:hypothetical protein